MKQQLQPWPVLSGFVSESPSGSGETTRESSQNSSPAHPQLLSLSWLPAEGGNGQDETQGLETQHMAAGKGQLWQRTHGEWTAF